MNPFLCPHCGQPLMTRPEGDLVSMYCAVGICDSEVCNNGSLEATPEKAYATLCAAYDKSPDSRDDSQWNGAVDG